MFKVTRSDGLALLGLVITITLVALDKADKLKGSAVLWVLLALAALMTIPMAWGNSWVVESLSPTIRHLKMLAGLLAVALVYTLLAIWILSPTAISPEEAGAVSLPSQKSSKSAPTPGNNIQIECQNAFLPDNIPASGRVWAGELSTDPNTPHQAGSTRELYQKPGFPIRWFSNGKPVGIYKCEIRNYGEAPIFNVEITFKVEFRKVVLTGATTGTTKHAGEKVASGDWTMPILRIDPGKESPFSFYLYNISIYFVTAFPPTSVSFLSNANDIGKKQEKIVLPDYPALSFSPFEGQR